ncbi:hypothetical protein GF373_17555 [bacterium]|nr:hypothetical protein [bacterium]
MIERERFLDGRVSIGIYVNERAITIGEIEKEQRDIDKAIQQIESMIEAKEDQIDYEEQRIDDLEETIQAVTAQGATDDSSVVLTLSKLQSTCKSWTGEYYLHIRSFRARIKELREKRRKLGMGLDLLAKGE